MIYKRAEYSFSGKYSESRIYDISTTKYSSKVLTNIFLKPWIISKQKIRRQHHNNTIRLIYYMYGTIKFF